MDIQFQKVSYVYAKNSPMERQALNSVDLLIRSGSFHSIIGHTGSGKSTVLQMMNGLLQPTAGRIQLGNTEIVEGKKTKNITLIRQQIGIVFQFPEHQLFEETVEKDIMFGPLNFGVSEVEAKARAKEYIKLVGLDETYLTKSPFELSGGQMRRVAIAGVLAMKPKVLILDEPTAGLDPSGRRQIMNLFGELHKKEGLTTILVTHSMDDAFAYAEDVSIMYQGQCVLSGEVEQVLSDAELLAKYDLQLPSVVRFKREVEKKWGVQLQEIAKDEEQLARLLANLVQKERGL